MRGRRAVIAALAVVAVVVVVAQVGFYFPRTVDDLFISLRYADHFAHGAGLVYNPGQHVEGFSSPLWVLLQSLGFVLGVEGVVATKLLSLLSLSLLFGLTWRYARRLLGMAPALAMLTLALLAADSYVMAWALLGLETPLYLALLLAWPLALDRHLAWNTRRSASLVVLVGLALCLARPEAPMYVALFGAAQVLEPRPGRNFRTRLRRALVPALVLLGAAVVLLLARHAYYGLWLPHTYYAKQGKWLPHRQARAAVRRRRIRFRARVPGGGVRLGTLACRVAAPPGAAPGHAGLPGLRVLGAARLDAQSATRAARVVVRAAVARGCS